MITMIKEQLSILVLDDHAMVREGIRYVLEPLCEHLNMLDAATQTQAMQLARQAATIDLVLIDLSLEGKSGFTALSYFTEHYPDIPCVILSASESSDDISTSIRLGAKGYVSKRSQGESLRSKIRLVLAGETSFPSTRVNGAEVTESQAGQVSLSPRQQDVAALMIEGKPNKVIAAELNLAEQTVKMHVSAIFQKLGVHNRTRAVMEMNRRGINLRQHPD